MGFVFLIVVQVRREEFFPGHGAGRDGTWEGFFSYFSYCVHLLFKKKLLCLTKLVTLIFSAWQVSIM